MHKKMGSILLLVCGLLMATLSIVQSATAAELLQNGDFSNGKQGWHKGHNLDDDWDPLQDGNGGVTLYPPDSFIGMMPAPYFGTIIFQELNVTGIADQTITLHYDIWHNGFAPPDSGTSILPKIVWLDNNDVEHSTTLGALQDDTIVGNAGPPTAAQGQFTFPADARKLTRFKFVRNHTGQLAVDNVSLDIPGITPGLLPTITSLTPSTAIAQGDSLTITGANFGAGGPGSRVLVNGRSDGITINSWTDTTINVTLADPVIGGALKVEVDGSQSNRKEVWISSPFFEIDGMRDRTKAILGEPVHVTIGAFAVNGYTPTAGGITLSLVDPAGGTLPTHQFAPPVIQPNGGSILTVDTTGMTPGYHEFEIHGNDGVHGDQVVTGGVRIVKVDTTAFSEPGGNTPVSGWNVTQQGQINSLPDLTMTDSDGNPLSDYYEPGVTSDNPNVVLVHWSPYYGPELFARNNGTANVTVSHADGSSATLPITVNFPNGPSDPVASIVLDPTSVTNAYADPIAFTATGTVPLSMVGREGDLSFINDNRTWGNGNQSFAGTMQLATNPPPPARTDLFYATAGSGTSGSGTFIAPFTVTNDPTFSAANGWTVSLDPNMPPYVLEIPTFEFYTAASDTLAYTREYFGMHGNGSFHLDGLTPGDYKVCAVVGSGTPDELRQCYPNSPDLAGAQALQFTAGSSVDDLNFFFFYNYYNISGMVAAPGGQPYTGITMELVPQADPQPLTRTTDNNGDFFFDGIRSGQYTLRPGGSAGGGGGAAPPSNLHFNPPEVPITLTDHDVVQNFEVLTSTSTVGLQTRILQQNGDNHLEVTLQMNRQTAGGDDSYTLPQEMDLTLLFDPTALEFQSAVEGQALLDAVKTLTPPTPGPSANMTGMDALGLRAMGAGNTNPIMAGDLVIVDFLILGGGQTDLLFDRALSNFAPEPANAVLELQDLAGARLENAALQFQGSLVLTDATGPAMGNTGAFAYKISAQDDGAGNSTGATCTGETTQTLSDCTGVMLDFGNFTLSYFELTPDGDRRVYSYGTGAITDGQGAPLLGVHDINITMESNYSNNTITGSGLGVLDPNPPLNAPLRDELRGINDQVAFTFSSFSQVVQGPFGVFDLTMTISPADTPMPEVNFTHLPYHQDEDGGSQLVEVTLSNVPDRVVKVGYTTADETAQAGSDYTPTQGELIWQPGEQQLTKGFSVSILADQTPELQETYTVSLDSAANALLGPVHQATATIIEPSPTATTLAGVVSSSILGYEAGIQGATVVVENLAGDRFTTTTNDPSGHWQITNIPNGLYTITISAPGHAPYVIENHDLAGGSEDIPLPAGGLTFVGGGQVSGGNPWDTNGNGVLDLGDILQWLAELANDTPI